jgi:large subunit ribosomal protein L32
MAVPKKRTSVSRKGQRRGGHTHKLYAKTTSNCPNCGGLVKPHHVCPSCGYYKGNEVIAMSSEEETTENAE